MLKNIVVLFSLMISLGACSKKINQNHVLKDLKELSSDKYEGRETGTKGGEMAANYILDRFNSLGLEKYNGSYTMPFTFKNRKSAEIKGKNIIAYQKGKTDKVIIVSAHYDHVGIKNNVIYNGADDNASGLSALLAYAEYFKSNKPEHTIIFAAFDAEEMGLIGSKKFVENLPVSAEKVVLNINLDMIGQNDKNELYACGTYHYPQLKPFIFSKDNQPKIILGHDDPQLGRDDWTNQSDHYSFHQKKIPFIYFGVEDHKDYHQPTDDFENINQEFYQKSVKAILEIIKNIDQNVSLKTIFDKKD